MRRLIAVGFMQMLCGCAAPALPPIPAGDCPQDAHLPHPPIPQKRSIPVIIAWANTAAGVANKAIAERDICAGSYVRLKAWAESIAKHQ